MPSQLTPAILTALQSSGLHNPSLSDTIRLLSSANNTNANQPIAQVSFTGEYPGVQAVANLTASFLSGNGILLSWTFQVGANSISSGVSYEVRQGLNWNTATFVTRTNANSVFLGYLVAGTYSYLVKAYNGNLVYNSIPAYVTFTINIPTAPTLSVSLVGNYVKLTASGSTASLNIPYYLFKRDGIPIGQGNNSGGAFLLYQELISGTHIYSAQAFDAASNPGIQTDVEFTVPNFPNLTQVVKLSAFDKNKTNCSTSKGQLFIGVPEFYDNSETWQTHFTIRGWNTPQDQINAGFPHFFDPIVPNTWQTHFVANGWNTPQDQINAGFPVFCEPIRTSTVPPAYQEVFDFGQIYINVAVNVTYTTYRLPGTDAINIKTQIETSPDGTIWNPPIIGQTNPAGAVRFVRVTLFFNVPNGWAVWSLTSLAVALDDKASQTESGSVFSNSTDNPGTPVVPTKTWKAYSSVTVSVAASQISYAACDTTYPINPTGFNVMTFDQFGNRNNGLITWTIVGAG